MLLVSETHTLIVNAIYIDIAKITNQSISKMYIN